MIGQTYYIDPATGDDANDGLTPDRPLRTYATREFVGGDTVNFKRGTIIRDVLHTRPGNPQAPITYGAYGDGDKPAFLGSVSIGDPAHWVQERPSLWRYTQSFPSEVCNLIFNAGQSCGNLRWQIDDLRQPGQWYYTGIGQSSGAEDGREAAHRDGILYLYSLTNPGLTYSSIEAALWGQRQLARCDGHITLENLSFQNAGVHGCHGFHTSHVVIRNCDFRFIGGAVWHRERRIRFGNAIEFWDGASDITIEGCRFDNIYDSGVTHQGGQTRNIPQRLYFRHNLFIDCGMAAYECREPSQEVYFEYNTCINSGGGFSMQGETPPRQSEIHPQPMGHHVFIWHIDPNTQPGRVYIRHNIFSQAPYGAAIYSIIAPADERQFVIDHNCYWQTRGTLLVHMAGHSYPSSDFARYQANCQQDRESVVADPLFVDIAAADFRLKAESPCKAMGAADLAAEISTPPLRNAVECTVRGGLPNTFAKLEGGQELRIVYLGGSITDADGWRSQSHEWFSRQFPGARVSQINAAIGGTGSDLGAFRLQRDVLQHQPDLLFVEFAVNDAGAPIDRIHKAFEGIVRQTWKANPNTDICFVYTLTQDMLSELQQGKIPNAASAMEQIADHYAIPSIHMGLEVARMQQTGKVIFAGSLPESQAGMFDSDGRIIFSYDGVHPYTRTGHLLYTQALIRAMQQIRPAGIPSAHTLVAPMRADNWQAARLLPISKAQLSPGWQMLDLAADALAKPFQHRVPELWKTNQPGQTLTIRFKGTSLLIYDLLGPDCGQVSITVDGRKTSPHPRFDSWCVFHRLAMLAVCDQLPDTIHTVTIELLPDQPDKLAILHQRKENAEMTELDPIKYNDTAFYPAAILLIGELVDLIDLPRQAFTSAFVR